MHAIQLNKTARSDKRLQGVMKISDTDKRGEETKNQDDSIY
jgi:hypothetical protein